MTRPSVLVIIVSYKSAKMVTEGLRLLAEERREASFDLTAVVIDNDSGDAPEIRTTIDEHQLGDWVQLIVAEKNGGFAYGNNIGFRLGLSQSKPPDYFHLLNPDAFVRPGAVGALIDFLQAHPRAGIAGSGLQNEDGSSWSTAFRFPSILSEIESSVQWGYVSRLLGEHAVPRAMSDVPEEVDWVQGSSMMVRRALIEEIGGLDESFFLYWEETDFCRLAKAYGWSCWHVPQSQVVHLGGQTTGTGASGSPHKRMPRTWFDSRARYFVKNHGLVYAMATDAAAVASRLAGAAKRAIMGKSWDATPHYTRDLIRSSPWWPSNRVIAPASRDVRRTAAPHEKNGAEKAG